MGDVVLVDFPEEGGEVEATVARGIERTEHTVRVTLRVEGREDFVKEWPLGEMVTVVRALIHARRPRDPVRSIAPRSEGLRGRSN